ncbi:hypothetical protein MMC34_005537 [Xylographa carneopallida]|nr:hypothetical protein [Xylographa carneopallida]
MQKERKARQAFVWPNVTLEEKERLKIRRIAQAKVLEDDEENDEEDEEDEGSGDYAAPWEHV